MKKLRNIIYIFTAVVTCVIAVNGFSVPNEDGLKEIVSEKFIGQEQCYLQQLYDIPRFGVREIDFTTISSGPITSPVKHLQTLKAAVRVSEVRVLNSWISYLSHIVYFPVRVRKVDLLFPFHYFF